jgi:hypothetical protein
MAFKNLLASKFKEFGADGSSSSYSYEGESGGLMSVAGTLLAVILVILIILIIVHYTITPIFRFTPGGKGYITVPGITRDDGAIYWEQEYPHGPLDEQDTIFGGQNAISKNYTLSIDFYFNDLNQGLNSGLRPLFYRYNPIGQGIDYSVGIFLDSQVNDILVQVRTVAGDTEVIRLKNVIAKIPIRVGVVVGEQYFEAYRNGQLVATRRLASAPKGSGGVFWADPGSAPGSSAAMAAAATTSNGCTPVSSGPLGGAVNLHLWRRVLSPGELKFSTPALPSAELFKTGAKSSFLSQFISPY